MPAIPASTKTSLDQRLTLRAKERWPQLVTVRVRYHGQFAYVEGQLTDGGRLPLSAAALRWLGHLLGVGAAGV
ncbi:hypothetical protein ACQEVF_01290 [Nonomuraea polychroma]|uniref:hypothetical protein n=1 Tax=Nonomuraea polychroma TaxID=46176 RepID=UPI003D8F5563